MGSIIRQKWNIITPEWPGLTSTGQNNGNCVTGVAESLLKKTCTSSKEGREGVKWELGLALLWTGKMGFTHWDWD